MSDGRRSASSPDPERPHPELPDLERQRKRAKELLRAARADDRATRLAAAERFVARLPRLAGHAPAEVADGRAGKLSLSEAQLVVAREAGYPSWPRMKHDLESETQERAARLDALIEAAVRGDAARVDALLAADPELPRGSLQAACALGEAEAALALLRRRPGAAIEAGGPLGWPPILTLTGAALATQRPGRNPDRVRIARALLAAGADPTVFIRDGRLIQGFRTTLSGAVVYAKSAELLEVLLEAGAAQTKRLWNTAMVAHAAELDDLRCLELLLRLEPPSWELRGALAEAIERDDLRAVRMLLDAGANPDAGGVWGNAGSSLHHAVVARAGAGVLEALLDAGANVDARDRDGRTALRIALRTGHREAERLLRARGATVESDPLDRLLAAALGGEAVSDAERAADDEVRARLGRTDHQLLSWALQQGRAEALPALLALGLDPDVHEDGGALPLGIAAAAGDAAAVRALLDGGARVDARDLDGKTALQHARTLDDPADRARIARLLLDAGADAAHVEDDDLAAAFERAADAIVDGDVEALRSLLADRPALATARSARPHRATLLHYIGANGLEEDRQRTPPQAVEILRLLLDAGSEPDALARTYGGGPAQTTLALLASSDHPARAGLQAELVRVLCDAGANPDGLDGDGIPLATAIAFRQVQSVDALAERARLDNALFAAAAGRVDLLRRELAPAGGRLRDGAGHCRVPWLGMARDPATAAQQALVVAGRFGRLDALRLLIERGVDPGAAPDQDVSALHEAAFAGHVDVVEELLDRGVDPGRRERLYDSTVLGWALEGDRPGVIERILARHRPALEDAAMLGLVDRVCELLDEDPALVDAPDGSGKLLRWAAWKGMRDLVALLLERGADRSIANPDGKRAIDLARAAGHAEIVALLER